MPNDRVPHGTDQNGSVLSLEARQLAQRFLQVRHATDALAAGLSAEDCALQSMPDASPVKWHLGHTTWFFETFLLQPHGTDARVFREAYGYLFNSYYDTIGARHPRPQRGLLSRPPLDEVLAYRRHVDAGVEQLLAQSWPLSPRALEVFELGLHHEQQHQELILTDFKHLLSFNPLRPAYRPTRLPVTGSPAPLRWHQHPEGLHRIGHDGGGFSFDNEGPAHRCFVEPFELASRLVTNAEFAEFIDDNGYRRPELWMSDGWQALQANGWEQPLYWGRDGRTWLAFTLSGLHAIAPDEPVCHLSWYEADAYARWIGARLPTEIEWEIAAKGLPVTGNFVESGRLRPVTATVSDSGVLQQMFGDVWEWTGSAYLPYPGYRPSPGALGEYNGKFMVNQFVLRGGSCATPQSHVRGTYRNFFPPHARWQFSGLRLARDLR